MKTKTGLLLELWIEARTRFTKQLEDLTPEDLRKKLLPAPNSVGFLIRHMGDVELLFAKNVFGNPEVKVVAKTVIDGRDTGVWTDLQELKDYVKLSFEILYSIVAKQTDADWETVITTKEFGVKTKAEAFGRIISHTAYHAGQMAVIKKYGAQ
ncbi:DinB family protein [Chryseobacterium sp.]|uniref:DinB family protein n=1 Tax=Chryseobacterium sp. TaxID=1871047 RepID=UPI0011CC7A12|nr:DinB family protein [Chryseobacterium sp.]TXF79006.1 DinB family protein [Chryseobacterium sp.]